MAPPNHRQLWSRLRILFGGAIVGALLGLGLHDRRHTEGVYWASRTSCWAKTLSRAPAGRGPSLFCCSGCHGRLSAAHVTQDRSAAAERALVGGRAACHRRRGRGHRSALRRRSAITPNSVHGHRNTDSTADRRDHSTTNSTVRAEVGRIGLGNLPRFVRGFERMEVTSDAMLSLLSPLTSPRRWRSCRSPTRCSATS